MSTGFSLKKEKRSIRTTKNESRLIRIRRSSKSHAARTRFLYSRLDSNIRIWNKRFPPPSLLGYLGGGGDSDGVLDVAPLLVADARMLRWRVEHQQEPRYAPCNADRAGHVEDGLPSERGDEVAAYRHGYRGAERRGCQATMRFTVAFHAFNRALPRPSSYNQRVLRCDHVCRVLFSRTEKKTVLRGILCAGRRSRGELDGELDHLPIILETNLLRSVGGIHRAVIGWIAGQVAP